MMVGKDADDLGLSLTLGSGNATRSHHAAPRARSSYQIPTSSPSPFRLDLMMPAAAASTSAAASTTAASSSNTYSLPHHNNPFAAVTLHNKNTATTTTTPSWFMNAGDSNPFHFFSSAGSSTRPSQSSAVVVVPGTTTTTITPHIDRSSSSTSFLKGIDVNRLPSSHTATTAVADEDEAGVSSPNSTLSSVSGKRCEREPTSMAIIAAAAVSTGSGDNSGGGAGVGSDDEDGDTSRKKLRLSKDQSAVLEESFKEHNTLNPKQKLALAKRLGLRPRQVEVWFQNRRARTKLKQTEVDCEFLRRCCEQLTEENRRLQKEVQELRALKLSPQFYMQMTPPTTLTMCPSCERVGGGNSATAAAQPQQQQQHGCSGSGSASTSVFPHNKAVSQNHHHRGGVTATGTTGMNPWAVTRVASPVPIRSIEPLQPRS